MILSDAIFKAYDIRGVVETELTPVVVERIGQAFGSESRARGCGHVVVSRDGRLTGATLIKALKVGLLSSGCDVTDIGEVPTPLLYFATMHLKTGTGIQITGSHNPPEYNGLKMMIGGTTLSGEAIQALKSRILMEDFQFGSGNEKEMDIFNDYKIALLNDINVSRALKLVIDCGNGVAGGVAPDIFRALGCEVIELFCEVDGRFPNHHPDPSQEENLEDIIQKVRSCKADFGMAFDGDGDRLGIVTANGDVVWPDRQMLLFASDILETTPGAEIIYDVKCSQILPKYIEEKGGKATMWKTGHSFIKAKIKETGAALAGEMSGHIFFNDRWGGFDDGIYAGARLCELLTKQHRSATAVFESLPNSVNTPELRLEMNTQEHHQLMDRLYAEATFGDAKVSTIDGIRVDFSDGFGLIRASNTTPTIIMRFESTTKSGLSAIQEKFKTLLYRVDENLELPF